MGQLIPWLQVTIPGFLYIAAVFFFLLIVYNKSNLEFKELKEYKEYALSFAILIVFFSYVVGYAVHLTIEQIFYCIWPGLHRPLTKLMTLKIDSTNIYQTINDTYSNLVMFRHLFLSTFFLGLFFSIWLYKIKQNKNKWVPILFILFLGIFLVAYVVKRQDLLNLKSIYL